LIKSIHHICIETDKYIESVDFYCSILGFSILEETKDFHGRDYNTWLKKENIIIELQTPKSGASDYSSSTVNTGVVHVCFTVESLTDAIDKLTEKGFNSFRRKGSDIIYNVKGGLLAKITTPEGTVIELREE
jgi:glyoxylase I family protein